MTRYRGLTKLKTEINKEIYIDRERERDRKIERERGGAKDNDVREGERKKSEYCVIVMSRIIGKCTFL